MNAPPFELWLSGYISWRKAAAVTLGARLPSEFSQLIRERQELEPLRYEAGSWASDAQGYYYAAKLAEIDRLWADVAKTAMHDIAKARCHKQLWARENAAMVEQAVISRAFKVDAEIKRLEGRPPK